MENTLDGQLALLTEDLLNRVRNIDERLKRGTPDFKHIPRSSSTILLKPLSTTNNYESCMEDSFLLKEMDTVEAQQQRLRERIDSIRNLMLKRNKSFGNLTVSTGILSPPSQREAKFVFPTYDSEQKKRRNTEEAIPPLEQLDLAGYKGGQNHGLPTVRSELENSYSDGESVSDKPVLKRSLKSELKELSPEQAVQLSPSIETGGNSERSLQSEQPSSSGPAASMQSMQSINEQLLNVPTHEQYMESFIINQRQSTTFRHSAQTIANVIGKIEKRIAERDSQTSRSAGSGRSMSERQLTTLMLLQETIRGKLLSTIARLHRVKDS